MNYFFFDFETWLYQNLYILNFQWTASAEGASGIGFDAAPVACEASDSFYIDCQVETISTMSKKSLPRQAPISSFLAPKTTKTNESNKYFYYKIKTLKR